MRADPYSDPGYPRQLITSMHVIDFQSEGYVQVVELKIPSQTYQVRLSELRTP